MRTFSRSLAVGALALPLALGGAGLAFADGAQGQDAIQGSAQDETAGTAQGNANGSPVTQGNPAVNGSDIAGLGSFFDEGSNDQDIRQDNSVDSDTVQGNKAKTMQGEKSEQGAQGGDQSIESFFGGRR
jgi:hypothetical protein